MSKQQTAHVPHNRPTNAESGEIPFSREGLAFLGEIAQFESTGYSIYFPIGAGAGAAASLCWAQAPSPKAVAKTAMTMIIFRNFNLSTSFRRGLLRFV